MFRISNDFQRAKTLSAIEGFKKQRENIENTKGKKIADLFWKGSQRMVQDLGAQINQYDKLRKDGPPPFQGGGLKELGAYLIDARIASGITQEELAKKIGVSQPMVYKYEINEYHGYSLKIVEKAATALGVKVDLSAWRKSAKPVYEAKKQENAILYFLNTINNAFLARTKLMKLLYYVDFEFYDKQRRPITGDEYVAQRYGPVPKHADDLLKQMEKESKIHSEKTVLVGYDQIKYYPKIDSDPNAFDSEEHAHIENVAKRFEYWTATQMTNQTHEEYPWQLTNLGDVIDYRLALNLGTKKE